MEPAGGGAGGRGVGGERKAHRDRNTRGMM